MADLPPGFQFFPSDEDLIVHFLYRKTARLPCQPDIIPTLDLHYCDPWDLSGNALQGGSNQWYFFTHSHTSSGASASGYWKSVGNDEVVTTNGDNRVGTKRTLVFYVGRAPEGVKTNWVMDEYHLLDGVVGTESSSSRRPCKRRGNTRGNKWVICRVYESDCGDDDGRELSCLDELYMSFDDLDEVSYSYRGSN